MLKKTITYHDYNGVEYTQDHGDGAWNHWRSC